LNEYGFNPYRARVMAGEPLTFINNGYQPHTIVARDGSWSTGMLIPTQIATIVFDRPGSFVYCSKEYPWSCGQIIIVPPSGSTATPAQSDQVTLGKSTYAQSCAACHGRDLRGRDPAPALAGPGFGTRWSGRDALALFDRIRTTMPPSASGSLSEDGYAAIVSYLLYMNDNPAPMPLDRVSMKNLAVTARTR
jgi:mono/diheme cytochrome c family protein